MLLRRRFFAFSSRGGQHISESGGHQGQFSPPNPEYFHMGPGFEFQVQENQRKFRGLETMVNQLHSSEEAMNTIKSGGLRSENCNIAEQLDGYHHQLHGTSHFENQTGLPNNTPRCTLSDNLVQNNLYSTLQAHGESSRNPDDVNGTRRVLFSGQTPPDPSGVSQFSSPSISSFSPSRYQKEGEQDRWLNAPGQGLMPISELNNPNSVKQILDQEQEISQLRNHLGEYSIKEAQIRNEKYVLEKRIAYMRMAFDQQQQDLVDAASKAISYRQDIIEENIRLAYALQAAQQERSTFVSSLVPLLAEYSLQPLEADAQSIVSNIKILFRHLQEKLSITEAKLKESQYQVAPWLSDVNSNFEMSPADSAVIKDGLDLVPRVISSSEPRTGRVWDPSVRPHYDITGDATKGMAGNDLGSSPSSSRETVFVGASTQFSITRDQTISKLKNEEIPAKQVTFSEISNSNATDDPDNERTNNDREPSASWVSKSSPYVTSQEDPMSTYSSYLPPVMEEPTTSYSEAADDDPLPAIEGLQISGEAYPGRELQASGYSINGTTSCIFEWIRHMEDGSYIYIDGAQQPVYLVTADDVDTYLAIEVRPLDDRKRKGEAVKVFANEHKKITCDSDMQNYIERTLSSGHASFNVSLWTGYLDIWEPAILAIKRDGFSIKCCGTNSVVVVDKFSPSIIVSIPFACPGEFSITDSRGDEHLLRATNISHSRDAIVLIIKYFILKAGEKKRKTRKRSLFFNKENKKR